MAKRGEDALIRHQKDRGPRCDRCDGVAVAGNPLFPRKGLSQRPKTGRGKFRHLDCAEKDAGILVDRRRSDQ